MIRKISHCRTKGQGEARCKAMAVTMTLELKWAEYNWRHVLENLM